MSSYHVSVTLPDGRLAVADVHESIVPAMRRIHAGKQDPDREPSPFDYAEVAGWLDNHCVQSALCENHIHGREDVESCGHRA
jgi:hypothetical protein